MLNLGSIQIPINAATKTFAILAKRGAGKTYTGAVMAEELFKANIPFVVIDPIDIWWGLRLSKNEKDKGLPVVVFGVEHADIKLDRDMGRQIAKAIIDRNVSCVISTFGLPKVGQRHLIAEFAEEILNINNTPRHIFIEEAHEFVPQRVFGAMGKTFNAVSNLVVMGRNRGLGVTLLNQRAATVNKDVLTQLDTLIAMRSVGPQDRAALRDWVEAHSAEGDFEKFIQSLPSLPTGEGWIWSPEFLGLFQRIKIRQRETFHPDREKIGEKFQVPPLNSMDVESFIADFSTRIEKEKVREKGPRKDLVEFQKPAKESGELIKIRNEYESKLLNKDVEIRNLRAVIDNIGRLIGVEGTPPPLGQVPLSSSLGSAIGLWQSKLGNGGAGRIFRFLAENSQRKFTRTQIALAVGLQSTSGSFNTYMSTLRSRKLIIKDGSDYRINPEL